MLAFSTESFRLRQFNEGLSATGGDFQFVGRVSDAKSRFSHAGQGRGALKAGGLLAKASKGMSALPAITAYAGREALARSFVNAAVDYGNSFKMGDGWVTLNAVDVVIAMQNIEGDYFISMWALDLLLQ